MTLEQLKQQFLDTYNVATLNYNNLYESIQKEIIGLYLEYPEFVSGKTEQDVIDLTFTFDEPNMTEARSLYRQLQDLKAMSKELKTHVVNVVGTIKTVELVKPKGLMTTINLSMGNYLGTVTMEALGDSTNSNSAKLRLTMEVAF